MLDPLKYRLLDLLHEGEVRPFHSARQGYGTAADIDIFIQKYTEYEEMFRLKKLGYLSDEKRYAFIDLTPFERIGELEYLVQKLEEFKELKPVLLVMSKFLLLRILAKFPNLTLLIAYYDTSGNFVEFFPTDALVPNYLYSQIINDVKQSETQQTLRALRRRFASQQLFNVLLHNNGLVLPSSNLPHKVVQFGGRLFFEMANKMLVSSFLSIKDICQDYTSLLDIAYETLVEITDHFTREEEPLGSFDYLVCANNTSLIIGSLLQMILNKQVIAIDRLGPIPRLPKQKDQLSEKLQRKRVIIIEEVVSTGGEVDRTVLFLASLGAEIKKIIATYNLNVGRAMLPGANQLVSLCQPKEELGYVYRSG